MKGSVSRSLSTQVLQSISVGFTCPLQQRRRAVLAGHSAPRHYTPSRLDSLTFYSSEEGQCQPVTQHPGTTLHLGWIHLQTTAAKKGSVSRSLSTQALQSISVGFTYPLQQRRQAVLAGHSAPRHYTPSRLDLLTCYSSNEGQC